MCPLPLTSLHSHSKAAHQGQAWLGGYRMSPQALQARSISLWPRASLKCSRHSESLSGITRFMPRYSTLGISTFPLCSRPLIFSALASLLEASVSARTATLSHGGGEGEGEMRRGA